MPELPEVETIKNYLKKNLIGKKILAFKSYNKSQIKVKEKDVIDEKILDIQRRGKILILKLTNNKDIFIHLKMTGQLIYSQKRQKSKFTRAILKLCLRKTTIGNLYRNSFGFCENLNHSNSHQTVFLIFNDVRKFGWMKLKAKEIEKLGIEPFSKEFNLRKIEKIFKQTKRPIKIVLMDQKKIAGIGNIYANEALFLAKISPQKPANQLTTEEIKKLKSSILKVLKKAIKYEGTSSRFYIKPDQSKGRYQEKFLVYQKEGEKCFYCHNKIKRIILGGRSTFYCPECQK